MAVEMGYLCVTCGQHWTVDQWDQVEAHLSSYATHKVTEGYFSDADPTPFSMTTVIPSTAAVGEPAFGVITANTSATLAQLQAGFLSGLYDSAGDLPVPPAVVPGFAFVDNGTSFPDVYWWQVGASAGSVEWQQSTYANNYTKPPDPNGDWLVDPSYTNSAGGSAWTQYSMGTEFRILAAGDGKEINGVAFHHGTAGGGDHNWVLLKSTSTGTTQPSISTYTTVSASGTFTQSNPGGWTEVTLGSTVTTAENEWYCVMMWAGTGGLSASISSLRSAGQTNESYALINAGVYAPGASTSAPGSNPTPTTRQTSTLYGVCSVRIK